MAVSGRKDSKRIQAFRYLKEALALFQAAAQKGISAIEALEKLETAGARVKKASGVAEPTSIDIQGRMVQKRDGLPADIRRKIDSFAKRLESLTAEVKAIPVTKAQVEVARDEKRRRRAEKAG